MQITTLASGSGGNCTLVSTEGAHILIDAGISMRRIKTALGELGLFPQDISGVLVTHEHSDHISGLATMTKQHQIPIYAPRTVGNHLRWSIAGVDDFISEIRVGQDFCIGDLSIRAFTTPHDTPESVGYRLECGYVFGFCTDFGHVTEEIVENLTGSDAVLIESNHDVDMLKAGPYPFYLKKRILSDRGHLSNTDCGQLAAYLFENGTRDFILGHLSKENNRPSIARDTVSAELCKLGVTPGKDISLQVAPELGRLSLKIERQNDECSA